MNLAGCFSDSMKRAAHGAELKRPSASLNGGLTVNEVVCAHQSLPRPDVGDVNLLQTRRLTLRRVRRRLNRLLADAVQSL